MTAMQARHAGRDIDGPISEAWKPDPGRYDCEEPQRYHSDEPAEFPSPYYGFDHVDMVTAHGDKANGHYRQWFRDKHPDWEALHDPANELPHDYSCPQAYRTPVPEESYPTAYIRDRARDYLTAHTDRDSPFFCYVSFPDPHHPFNPPGKYWDLYDPDDFELPTRFEDHRNPPPPLLAARQYFEEHGGGQRTPQHAFMETDRHVREAMALTAGMISMIDDAVGALVQTLKDTGQYDNTVIIFNADHGDYLGDFNMLQKGAWAQRSIHRVPMIWSDPREREARTTTALASTIDISATIRRLCPRRIHGERPRAHSGHPRLAVVGLQGSGLGRTLRPQERPTANSQPLGQRRPRHRQGAAVRITHAAADRATGREPAVEPPRVARHRRHTSTHQTA